MEEGKRGRSLSYNDLKIKRYLREEKSKRKHTQSDKYHSEIKRYDGNKRSPDTENISSDQLKSPFQQNKYESDIKDKLKFETPKKEWVTRTDRMYEKKSKKEIKKLIQVKERLSFDDPNFDSKQLIRGLIQKRTSAKKLLKLSELRDKLKESKDRSRSKEKDLLEFQQNILNGKWSQERQRSPNLRVKKFYKDEQQEKNKKELKENSGIKSKTEEVKQRKEQKANKKGNNNLLDLLEVPQNDLKKVLKMKSHEHKRKNELAKLKPYFPEGFFQF